MPSDTATAPATTPDTAAACRGVVKIYSVASGEVHALKGVDASFRIGEISAVVGPSGSGKSSLLRILAGLDRPDAGSVSIDGTEVDGFSDRQLRRLRRQRIGYVFQRPSDNLVPQLSVTGQLERAARVRRIPKDRVADAVDDLLDALGIAHRRDHLPQELSGGEQQRVAVAQAVIGGPALVVADEPTAELDSRAGGALLDRMAELAGRGVAMVLSTHDADVVARADRTLALRHGAIEAETTRDGVLSVIDDAGRIQLPPEALDWFADRRAVLRVVEVAAGGAQASIEVRITPRPNAIDVDQGQP